MNDKKQESVPFQIEHLIKSMLGGDNIYVRSNFRSRLVDIRDVIDKAIKKYDTEYNSSSVTAMTRKKRK